MDKAEWVRRIERNMADETGWRDALRAFMLDRDFASVHALLRARHEQIGDAASFTLRMIVALLVEGHDPAACRWLVGRSSPDSAFHGLFGFGAGMEAGLVFHLDEAATFLRLGAWRAWAAYDAVFQNDAEFRTLLPRMMRDANLIEPAAFDAAGGVPGLRLPELAVIGGPDRVASDVLVVAACDGRYFHHYHERFLSHLKRYCPNRDGLLHVINPEPALRPVFESLLRDHPRLRITTEYGPPYKVYYASCRFLIAERVMDRFGCGVVLVDIDGIFREDFPHLLERASAWDVVYLGVPGETTPVCRISAAFLLVRDSATGRRFLRRNRAYLERKLAIDPIWMVDQAALFRTICLTQDDSARITDLNACLDTPFDLRTSLVDPHLLPEVERHAARAPFGIRPLAFTPDKKPLYQTAFSVWDWERPAG